MNEHEFAPVVELFHAPAICIRGNVMVCFNSLARKLFPHIKPGDELTVLPISLGPGSNHYVSDGRVYHIRFIAGERVLLFDDVTDLLTSLDLISGALRHSVGALFYTGESFFPAIEEMNNPIFHEQISIMTRAFCRILKIANNLRDFSGLTKGAMALHTEEFDADEWLTDFFERIRPLVASTGRQPDIRISRVGASLLADRERLETALLNLISVSMADPDQDNSLRLMVFARGSNLVFSVSNFGNDTYKETYLSHIAKFPERADPNDTEGVGIALGLCRCIAELHGGRIIWGAGEHGTNCSFIIPLHNPKMEVLSQPAPYNSNIPAELVYLSGVLPSECYRFFF